VDRKSYQRTLYDAKNELLAVSLLIQKPVSSGVLENGRRIPDGWSANLPLADYGRFALYPLAMSGKRRWSLQRPKRLLHAEELSSLIAIEANLRWKRATRMRIR